tara:strand:- start:245 stop:946 length:702 start_codon:yes stop_codon:yes gene_type:complete
LQEGKTVMMSHRGYKKTYPENTLLSIEDAKECGFQWVEIDLVSTKDKIVLCSHNLDLETETNGVGYIHDTLYEKINVLHTGVNSHPLQIQRIPRLKDVFSKFSDNMKYNLEIKTRSIFDLITAKGAVKLAAQMKIEDYMVSSFNPVVILYLKLFQKKVTTALLLDSVKYMWLVNWLHPSFVNIRGDLIDNTIINHSRKHGYGLIAWTINSEMGIQFCIKKNINAVITDRELSN